jgi:hypothetical protein
MNPDSQNPIEEPEENGGMPQAPTTGAGNDQTPAPTPTVPPEGDDEGDTPEVPEASEGGGAPEAPAADESDKEDGAKW